MELVAPRRAQDDASSTEQATDRAMVEPDQALFRSQQTGQAAMSVDFGHESDPGYVARIQPTGRSH